MTAAPANTRLLTKSPAYRAEKTPTYGTKKHPPIQYTETGTVLEVSGPVGVSELSELVTKAGWRCWSSQIRINALLMLVADAASRVDAGTFPFSRDRARLLCSPLAPRVAASHNAPREGLAALVKLGVIEQRRAGRRYPVAQAAEYRFAKRFAVRGCFAIRLSVTPKQAARWHDRHKRICEDFEQKNPIVAVVRETAGRMELSAQGIEELRRMPMTAPMVAAAPLMMLVQTGNLAAAALLLTADAYAANCARAAAACAERCYQWLQEPAGKLVLDSAGTLHSPVSVCPKVIRPFLQIDGQDVGEVDISGAHIAVLPKLYDDDFLGRYGIKHTAEDAERERQELIAHIESGDVYGGSTPAERKKNKLTLLTSLNMPLKAQMAMPVTHELLAGRPILEAAIKKVKQTDHRALSRWLRRWTSDTVNPAVLALHARGIPSIPITDCLMVRKQDEAAAREELSSRLFAATGVRAMVGGVRWAASQPQIEAKAA